MAKVRDLLEHRNRRVVAGIELQIDEAADQFCLYG